MQGLTLLRRMLYPTIGAGRPDPARVTVTLPSGEAVSGTLASRDEFTVAMFDAAGQYRAWPAASVKAVMWMTDTYDPELNLVFVGTGNPTPVLNGAARPGDNSWTCSIVALNPDTGALAWGFQASPHDTHDWDAVEVPVLVDADFNGTPRKLLLQASRNGYFFVLDRTSGRNLLTKPFGVSANTTSFVNARERTVLARFVSAPGQMIYSSATPYA